jgi:uncharacterized protein (TIGR02646 family)
MKHVTKGTPPAEFEAWKSQANEDWKPTYDELQNPQKRNLHQALLDEQGSVCCYCGRSVTLEDSHIEHFKPQERYGALQLEYTNLYASCLRGQERTTSRHCGHAKGNGFDEARYIAPVDPDCEQRFMYTLRGAVIPTDSADARAQYMIDLLALDGPALRNLRDEVLSRVMDPAFLASATKEELTRLKDGFRRRDAAGNHVDFGHVLARYAEQTLAEPVAASSNADTAVSACASDQD